VTCMSIVLAIAIAGVGIYLIARRRAASRQAMRMVSRDMGETPRGPVEKYLELSFLVFGIVAILVCVLILTGVVRL
jgi:hypothetical protein